MPQIEAVLLKFRPTKVERRAAISFLYSTDQLITKIKNIRQQIQLNLRSGRPVTDQAILMFLYKIDFVIARHEVNGKPQWTFFDQNRFIANDAIDFGYKWEVHPAYRWAIQPNDIQDVIRSISAGQYA